MARPRKSQRQPPTANSQQAKAVLYARVSTKEQEEEGFSVEAQLGLLRKYCEAKGFTVVKEFVEAETAKKEGRTEFGEMIRLIRQSQRQTQAFQAIQAVVVEKTDRIYRNLRDRVTIDELGVELHLVKENTVLSRTSRSHEKFVHDIKLIVAKNYIDNLSEETSKGMEEKARQGLWPSVAPVGYRNVSEGSRRVIEPDPECHHLVKELFTAYASGKHSIKTAGAHAHSLGLRTKTGREVHISSLHLILQNPLYAGMVPWRGKTYKGSHQPIIDAATFERCQSILNGRVSDRSGTSANPDFIYKGLFRCRACGCAITAETKKGHIYYHCTGHKGCPRIGIREEEITLQIAVQLEALSIRPAAIDLLREILIESSKEQREEHAGRLAALRTEKEKKELRLERLYQDKITGDVPLTAYRKLKAEWEEDLAQLEVLIAATDRANRSTWEENIQMLEAVSNAFRTFTEAGKEEKREMLQNLFSHPQISARTLHLEPRSWFKKLLEANTLDAKRVPEKPVLEDWLPLLEALQTPQAA